MTKEADILADYKIATPEERFEIMFQNYTVFPKAIKKLERKTQYKIKADREYYRSHHRGELGVRVQTSNISSPTEDEAIADIEIEEALKSGRVDRNLLKDFDDAGAYIEDIRFISIMRMDYELLVDCVASLDDDENLIITEYLNNRKFLKEIAVEHEMSYSNMKRKYKLIKAALMDDVVECLVKNCR